MPRRITGRIVGNQPAQMSHGWYGLGVLLQDQRVVVDRHDGPRGDGRVATSFVTSYMQPALDACRRKRDASLQEATSNVRRYACVALPDFGCGC